MIFKSRPIEPIMTFFDIHSHDAIHLKKEKTITKKKKNRNCAGNFLPAHDYGHFH